MKQKKSKEIAGLEIKNVTINSYLLTKLNYIKTDFSNCDNNGQNGTYYKKTETSIHFSVLPTIGAENTEKALFLSNRGFPSNFPITKVCFDII